MTPRFGTDGVRAPADELTDGFVAALGRAAAEVLGGEDGFLIGRDTRLSGPRLERALAGGMAASGAVPQSLGVVPTPAVAWVSAARGVPGAVISASHNPWSDNGIKFFAAGGRKLADDVELELESVLDELLSGGIPTAPLEVVPLAPPPRGDAWLDAVVASVEGRRLEGLRVVIDCANGASAAFAAGALRQLGAEVDVLHAEPDGRNINNRSGSTHPEDLQRAVVGSGAMVGLAFDGDADRVLAVDETGRLIDGDHLIALFAIDLRERERLHRNQVVVTVMTNLGFRMAMAEHGIDVVETGVGDRQVLAALEQTSGSLGGEQSGHIVFADLATTGDGLLSGVQLLDLLVRSGAPLSQLAAGAMTQLPQVLVNVRVAERRDDIAEVMAAEIAAEETALGGRGRVLVRPSGTEPLVRVMVEAELQETADAVAHRLADVARLHCGESPVGPPQP
ncbi:MAG TPA: phosphoglucosamine mutase [Acidimicrobiales bacterium]